MPTGMAPVHSGSMATKPRTHRASGVGSRGTPRPMECQHALRIDTSPPLLLRQRREAGLPPYTGYAVTVSLGSVCYSNGYGERCHRDRSRNRGRVDQMRTRTVGTPGGAKLRALREGAGRTQLWVEVEAGLGTGYLQRVESGRV